MKSVPKTKKTRESTSKFLQGLSLFHEIPENSKAFKKFKKSVDLLFFKKSEIIYKPGARPHDFYLVKDGEVRIHQGEGIQSRIISINTSGGVFGEASFFTHEAHATTAIASLDSRVYKIDGQAFLELLSEEPSVGEAFTFMLSRRLRHRMILFTDLPSMVFSLIYAEHPITGNEISELLSENLLPEEQSSIVLISFSKIKRNPSVSLHEIIFNIENGDIENIKKKYAKKRFLRIHASLDQMDDVRILNAISGFLGLLKYHFTYIVVDASENPEHPVIARFINQSDNLILIRPPASNNQSNKWKKAAKKCKTGLADFPNRLITVSHETIPGERPSVSLHQGRMDRDFLSCGETTLNINHFRIISGGGSLLEEREEISLKGIRRMARHLSNNSRAICLGGGGSRSFSQAGVFEIFEKEGIDFDAVSGSSMGAVIGAGYAMGLNAREIRYFIKQYLPNSSVLLEKNLPFVSFFRGRKLTALLERIFREMTFEELEVPLYCIGSDLNTGRKIIFERGPLVTAMRATASIPGIFPPYYSGHFAIVDGGVLDNMPGSILREKGFHKVIGVNVTPRVDRFSAKSTIQADDGVVKGIRDYFTIPPIMKIITRSLAMQGRALMNLNLSNFDYVLHPEISTYQMFDFHLHDEIIRTGRKAAKENIQEIKKILSNQPMRKKH